MLKQVKAFTLVELLVAMAIIGVLIGLSLFGISAAQRNSRDTARRAAVQDINAGMADYFSQTGRFPSAIYFDTDEVLIDSDGDGTCASGEVCVPVPLDGAAIPNETGTAGATVGSPDVIGEESTVNDSQWCYGPQTDGYTLAVKLESGESFEGGTSNTDCNIPD